MSYSDKKFLVEMSELIKSLMNFCRYEVKILQDEINIFCDHKDIGKILLFLKDNPSISMEVLIDITAVDYPSEKQRFLLVYNLLSVSKNIRVKVKTRVSENVSVGTVFEIYSCANWYEREIWDLFGISFSAHPDLRRILTDYGFKGHPLRKDFPLTGHNEVRYSEDEKKVIYEPVKLEQNYRNFDYESPWEGTKYIKEQTKK